MPRRLESVAVDPVAAAARRAKLAQSKATGNSTQKPAKRIGTTHRRAPPAPGTGIRHLRASRSAHLSPYDLLGLGLQVKVDTDSTLAALLVQNEDGMVERLTPRFDPGTSLYGVAVPFQASDTSVRLMARATSRKASVSVFRWCPRLSPRLREMLDVLHRVRVSHRRLSTEDRAASRIQAAARGSAVRSFLSQEGNSSEFLVESDLADACMRYCVTQPTQEERAQYHAKRWQSAEELWRERTASTKRRLLLLHSALSDPRMHSSACRALKMCVRANLLTLLSLWRRWARARGLAYETAKVSASELLQLLRQAGLDAHSASEVEALLEEAGAAPKAGLSDPEAQRCGSKGQAGSAASSAVAQALTANAAAGDDTVPTPRISFEELACCLLQEEGSCSEAAVTLSLRGAHLARREVKQSGAKTRLKSAGVPSGSQQRLGPRSDSSPPPRGARGARQTSSSLRKGSRNNATAGSDAAEQVSDPEKYAEGLSSEDSADSDAGGGADGIDGGDDGDDCGSGEARGEGMRAFGSSVGVILRSRVATFRVLVIAEDGSISSTTIEMRISPRMAVPPPPAQLRSVLDRVIEYYGEPFDGGSDLALVRAAGASAAAAAVPALSTRVSRRGAAQATRADAGARHSTQGGLRGAESGSALGMAQGMARGAARGWAPSGGRSEACGPVEAALNARVGRMASWAKEGEVCLSLERFVQCCNTLQLCAAAVARCAFMQVALRPYVQLNARRTWHALWWCFVRTLSLDAAAATHEWEYDAGTVLAAATATLAAVDANQQAAAAVASTAQRRAEQRRATRDAQRVAAQRGLGDGGGGGVGDGCGDDNGDGGGGGGGDGGCGGSVQAGYGRYAGRSVRALDARGAGSNQCAAGVAAYGSSELRACRVAPSSPACTGLPQRPPSARRAPLPHASAAPNSIALDTLRPAPEWASQGEAAFSPVPARADRLRPSASPAHQRSRALSVEVGQRPAVDSSCTRIAWAASPGREVHEAGRHAGSSVCSSSRCTPREANFGASNLSSPTGGGAARLSHGCMRGSCSLAGTQETSFWAEGDESPPVAPPPLGASRADLTRLRLRQIEESWARDAFPPDPAVAGSCAPPSRADRAGATPAWRAPPAPPPAPPPAQPQSKTTAAYVKHMRGVWHDLKAEAVSSVADSEFGTAGPFVARERLASPEAIMKHRKLTLTLSKD